MDKTVKTEEDKHDYCVVLSSQSISGQSPTLVVTVVNFVLLSPIVLDLVQTLASHMLFQDSWT